MEKGGVRPGFRSPILFLRCPHFYNLTRESRIEELFYTLTKYKDKSLALTGHNLTRRMGWSVTLGMNHIKPMPHE